MITVVHYLYNISIAHDFLIIFKHLHDLWQLEYIIGKKNPHSFVNEVGQLRLQTIQEVFLANKRNAAFVDSCIAHGSYNHTKVKNLWNGAYPADNATSLNCAQAFQRWISSDEANIQQLYLQNRTFPCLTCCSS